MANLPVLACYRPSEEASTTGEGQERSMTYVNGVPPQIGNLPTQAKSTTQKAGIPEALLQAAKANAVQLQSH